MIKPRVPPQAPANIQAAAAQLAQMGPAVIAPQVEATQASPPEPAAPPTPTLSPDVAALVATLQTRHDAVCNEKARIEKAIQALTE